MRCKIRLNQIAESRKIRRFLGNANIDIARHRFAMNRLQAIVGGLEIWPDLTREEQAAIKLVGPLVIGAYELCRRSLLRGTNTRAAMAARIMERANAALRIAHDDDRIGANLYGHVGAGLGQFAIMADE